MKKEFMFDVVLDEGLSNLSNSVLPDPALVNFYRGMKNREIFINEDISDYIVDYVLQIYQWNKEDVTYNVPVEQRKKIKIFINTNGGDTTAMNALISAIKMSKTPCITIGLGKCFSAGAMILIAAKPENRYILPSTIVMIHKGSSGIMSDVNKIINYSKFLEKDNEVCKSYILESTNMTEAKYKEVEDKDWYIFGSECLEYGIVGSILKSFDELIEL